MLADAATSAAMPSKSRDHTIVDVSNRDSAALQPFSKVTGAIFIACHCQWGVPNGPQPISELLHKRT